MGGVALDYLKMSIDADPFGFLLTELDLTQAKLFAQGSDAVSQLFGDCLLRIAYFLRYALIHINTNTFITSDQK